MLNALKFVLRLQSRSLVMNCNGWLCLPCNVISRILRLFQIRWLWRVSKSGVPILEMCVGRWDRKSTAHVANSKICRISSKPTVNSIQPLFPVLAPSHHPALSSPHVHLRQSCRDRRQPPIGGASSPQLVTSHVSLILLLTKDTIAPLTSLTRYLVLHLLLARQARCKMVGRFGNKALGWGWAAMTVPQHNLFYLTPANASEHTAGHGGAQRTHSSPSFYTWWNQRRLAKDPTIAFWSCLKKLVKVINLVKPKSPIMKTKQ